MNKWIARIRIFYAGGIRACQYAASSGVAFAGMHDMRRGS